MKLHANHTDIKRGGVKSESTFTIKTNALSFSILSSGLYTDPEMAIVRELSCNAYDAHVAANNQNTPFEIHLPNDLEPFFSIKDFGIGLSDEDVQGEMIPLMVEDENGQMVEAVDDNGEPVITRSGGLYTTYFDSTKTNSNAFIGALGLGSKSPFSYTNAFEVISRHGGKKRTYAIFLNEEGIPSVALMGEINTDEHSGLEVKITIKPEDFYKFKQKTASALKYFPVKPIITGVLNFEFDKIPEHKIETKEWMLSSGGYYNNSIIAVQGNVAYRVDNDQLREHFDDRLNEFVNRSNIVMFFDIGDLEVSANREEIRYDKRSVENIVKRIKKINTEFTHEVENKIGQVNKKYWYACIELNQLARELFDREDAIRTFVDPEKVKNKNLRTYIENNGRVKYSKILGYDIFRYAINGYYSKSTKLKRSPVSNTIEPDAGTLVVVNDVKIGGIARLGNYLEDNSYNEALVIVKRSEPLVELDGDNKPIEYIGYEKEMKRLEKELGNPDIYNISEITEEPVKEHKTRELTFYKYDGLKRIRDSYYAPERISWEQTICKIEEGGLYIPLKYASSPAVIANDGKFKPISMDTAEMMVSALKFLISAYNDKHGTDHSIHALCGLPTAAYKKAIKNDKWINLFDFAKEILPNYVDEIVFHKSKRLTSNILNAKEATKYKEFVNNVKALDDDSTFKKAIMPIIEGNELYSEHTMNNVGIIEKLYRILLKDSIIEGTPFYDDDEFIKYPMLTLVASLSYDTPWTTLFDYIKLIDRS